MFVINIWSRCISIVLLLNLPEEANEGDKIVTQNQHFLNVDSFLF